MAAKTPSAAPVTPAAPAAAASLKSALLAAKAGLLQSLQKLTLEQNYVPARLPEGKVVGIWGEAIIRLPDGEVRELRIGDMVKKGYVIMTSQDGIVQLEVDGSRYARLPEREMLEPTGAGLTGGEDGSLNDSLRVARIAEVVGASEYDFSTTSATPYVPFGDLGNTGMSLSVSSPSVSESAGFIVFTVSLGRATTLPTTVDLTLADGSASGRGVDYGTTGAGNLQVSLDGGQTWVDAASVTLPAGTTGLLVRTPVIQDTLREGNETLTLTVTAQPGGDIGISPATGTGTIVDDEPLPQIQPVPDQTVNEGAGTVTFTITLSSPSQQTVSVDYRTVSGTATAGEDFTAVAGTLTFAPGETTKTITVPIVDDRTFEGAETFTLELSNPVNTTIADPTALVTIRDEGSGSVPPGVTPTDDTPHVGSVSSPTTAEGGNLDFNVTLTHPSTTPTVVTVTPRSDTATLGTDTGPLEVSFDGGKTFVPVTGPTVTVPAGSDSFIIRVPTVDDTVSEPTETIRLDVQAPADTSPTTGTGTITDNDGPPSVSVSGPAQVDEASGTATYTITLSNPSSQTVTVHVATRDGSATAGSDYTAVDRTLTFAAGETSKTISVAITNDSVFEGKETFSVVLDTPTQAVLGTSTVTTTIFDDGTLGGEDDRPKLSIDDVVVNEGSGTATFTVTLTGATTQTTTVAFKTQDGTATAGADYTAVAGTVTFAPGETTKTIVVPILNDTVYEGAETFNVILSTPTNAVIADGSGLGTIKDDGTGKVEPGPGGTTPTPDDDRPHVASITNASAPEGSPLDFTVTLSNASTTATAVTLTPVSGSATVGTDTGPMQYSVDGGKTYADVPASGIVSVPAGSTSFLVRIPTVDDKVYEGDETLTLKAATAVDTAPVSGTGT
ncbi:Calx-beta domain-containing protein, partial [Sphaerotilus uruguayifluvii]